MRFHTRKMQRYFGGHFDESIRIIGYNDCGYNDSGYRACGMCCYLQRSDKKREL